MCQQFGGKCGANLMLDLLVCVGVLKANSFHFHLVCAVEALDEKLWHSLAHSLFYSSFGKGILFSFETSPVLRFLSDFRSVC